MPGVSLPPPDVPRSCLFNRVLLVCVGNICRSPVAEALLRQRLGADGPARVSSAGLQALEGSGMDPTAACLLREAGVAMAAHRARQATPALLRAADLVLAMERAHVEAVVARVPQMRGRVFRLGHWEGVDVPDPYRQQRIAFEHVHALIERNLEHWLAHLGGQR